MPAASSKPFKTKCQSSNLRIVRSTLRSLASVIIGFVFVLLALRLSPLATDQEGFQFLTVVWTIGAAIIAGYLTALIAGSHEFPHAASVGLLLIVSSFVSMRQQELTHPGWYEITVAGCGPISAMIGCALRLLTKPRPKIPAQSASSTQP